MIAGVQARRRNRLLGLLATLGLCLLPAWGQAQEPVPYTSLPQADWYYASVFGTGRYRAGERTVSVLKIPAAWTLPSRRERPWSARLLLPLTLGVVDTGLDEIIGRPLDAVSAISFTPGVEFSFPGVGDWRLRAFTTAGGGAELDGDGRAWIYSAGFSAERPLPCRRWQCTLGLGATWAAHHARDRGREGMSSLSTGLDLVAPRGFSAFGRQLRPGLFTVYRNYLKDLDFVFDPLGIQPLSDEWELGLTLNADMPFKLFGYRFERFGLGYRRGDGLRGLHLVTGFPF